MFTHLARSADAEVAECAKALQLDVDRGALRLPAAQARACAVALEKASWKDAMQDRPTALPPECAGLLGGSQKADGACNVDAVCPAGMTCSGGERGATGLCKPAPPSGAACAQRFPTGHGFARAPCAAGQRCVGPAWSASFPLGYDEPETFTHNSEGTGVALGGTAGRRRGIDRVLRGESPRDDDPREPGFGSLGLLGTGLTGGGRSEGGARAKNAKLRMGAASVSGRLPPEVIQRIVRQSYGRFRLCYENGLKKDPALEGRVAVKFVIGRDGAVALAADADSSMKDKDVVSCIVRAFKGLSFPQPEGGVVNVVYPILFSPPDPVPSPAASASAASSASAAPPASAPTSSSPSAPPTAIPGTCAPLPPTCAHDGDCAFGDLCRAGSCARDLGAPGAACDGSTDCAAGLYCRFRDGVTWQALKGECAPRKKAGETCTSSLQCEGLCGTKDVCEPFCDGR